MVNSPFDRKVKKHLEREASRNKFVDAVVKLFASGFYVGYIPAVPGTAGAALGVVIYSTTVMRMNLHPLQMFFIYLGYFLLGVFITSLAKEAFHTDELNIIVFDKILGAMIAVSAFNKEIFEGDFKKVIVAFVIFRLWEIGKLFPLKPLERLPKGWGVMADDVGGGVIALLLVSYVIPEAGWKLLSDGITAL